ncbi:phage portal protein [Wansuia hejianensis]|uniref:Phage portal protein n=1 Tax=Wansuia hejianensis TaxID=2763667 RepID=A0A926F2B5_9FIRM|nr:phage portal protein [Wansuia hejianensis]MBC8590619.1 phage portal protein [Wansuia hejianensis]
MINYNELLKAELQGLYGDQLSKVNQILEWYKIYDGDQEWRTNAGLDYIPTKKITNLIKKLINTRARFMFGKEPFFDVRPVQMDDKGSTTHQDLAQEKEDLLHQILKDNKFHSKLLKAKKDCSIGGKVAIKLWGHKDVGLKIIFSPAMEFFPQFNLDDVDQLEKVVFLYALNNESDPEKQRIKKQVWEMQGNKCILNESTHDGRGNIVSIEYQDYDTGLDFIPVIIITNGGLTGEIEGVSDVAQLWQNQDAYNKLTSDDIDALKFQMFGQDVVTDASEDSLKNIKVAPGAMIDLQTDITQSNEGRQAKMERLESGFSYKDKFEDTVNRIKNDMYDTLDVPNVSLEQLKGLMQSGKSMKALYWGLMAACDEDWIEWGDALQQMVDYIFKMVDIYNLYGARTIAKYETTLEIERVYPIAEDEIEQKRIDMEEVLAEVRSRKSYMNKWGEYEDIDSELEQIQLEKQMLQDSYTKSLLDDLE